MTSQVKPQATVAVTAATALLCAQGRSEVGGMDQQVAVVTVVALLAVVVWFDWLCLRDIATAREVRTLPKQAWAILVVISFPIGPLLYYTYGKVR
jgi:hypothetical protein